MAKKDGTFLGVLVNPETNEIVANVPLKEIKKSWRDCTSSEWFSSSNATFSIISTNERTTKYYEQNRKFLMHSLKIYYFP